MKRILFLLLITCSILSYGQRYVPPGGSMGQVLTIKNAAGSLWWTTPTGGVWGSITGTLSNQTDLQNALNAKITGNSAITGATKTKITYDSKGLVTAGADATTTDIAEGTNLYWTALRFTTAFSGMSTTDLTEGTNLYFTNGRAVTAMAGLYEVPLTFSPPLSRAGNTISISGIVTSVTATGPITSSGGTTPDISTSMNTGKLIGRNTAGSGAMEEITLGTNLVFSGLTLNASFTEVDGSVSNELQTLTTTSDATSNTTTLSNSGGSQKIIEGTGITLTTGGSGLNGEVTIATTALLSEVDGSTTNELQTLANTSNSTTHTVTLSNSGGSVQLAEGSNVSLTTSGTGSDGVVTISSTEVDGSVSNELQTIAVSGTTTGITTLSNSGGSMTIAGAGINSVGVSGSTITVTGTEVDGSTTNEVQALTASGSGTTYALDLSLSGGSVGVIEGSNITIDRTGNNLTINAAPDTDTDDQGLTITGTGPEYTINIDGGSDVIVEGAGGITLSESPANTLIITQGAEIDGSITNEAFTIDADDADQEVISNQTLKFEGAGTTVTDYDPTTDKLIITSTEVDGSVSNELQTLSVSGTTTGITTLSNSGNSMTLAAGGINSIGVAGSTITVTGTEVDGSVSNELQTLATTSDATSNTTTLSNSGGSQKLIEGTGITLTTAGTGLNSEVTIATTAILSEVDGSITNELQTITASGSTTTYGIDLSQSGGTVNLIEGNNITIDRTGDDLTINASASTGMASFLLAASGTGGTESITDAETVTITAGTGITATRSTNNITISNTVTDTDDQGLTITGSGPTYNIDIDGGSDVIISGAGGITLTETPANTLVITQAAEVDGSTTNELQTISVSGTTTGITTLSNSGGSSTIAGAGINTVGVSGSTITITGTEVDGSTSNELQTLATTSDATSNTTTLSNSGGSQKLIEGTGIILTTAGTGLDGEVTIATTALLSEVDGSTTNEIQALSASGSTTTYGIDLSLSGGSVNLVEGTNVTIDRSTNNLTINSSEVDGSTTNELQTVANTSNSTTHTVTLSNSGGSVQLVEGSGITLTTTGNSGDGIVTIAATGGGGGVTDVTATGPLTSSGGVTPDISTSMATNKLIGRGTAGTGVFEEITIGTNLSLSGTTLNASFTEVDGSISNEGQWIIDGDDAETELVGNQTWKFEGAGGITTDVDPTNNKIIFTQGAEVDGSTTNEVQTISASGSTTTYGLDLSLSGGTVNLIEGTNVTIDRTGNDLTINAGSITDTDDQGLTLTGSGPTYTVDIDGGSDVIIEGAGGITLSESPANTLVITQAAEVDGSVTNEGQWTIDGDDAHTEIVANQTWKFEGAGGITTDVDPTNNKIIFTQGAEVDGSTTNEIQTLTASGSTTTYGLDLSLSGGTVNLIEGTGVTIDRTGNDLTINSSGGGSGITTLNTLTGATQTFAIGSTGTAPNFASSGTTHTLHIPLASASSVTNGGISKTDYDAFNGKFTLPSLTSGSVLFSNGTTIAQDNSNFFWNNSTKRLGLGTPTPEWPFQVKTTELVAAHFQNTTASASQTAFYMENDRGSFDSYGGFLYGSSTGNIGNVFDVSRTDKLFMFAGGASNLGMYVGTLSAQPFVIGTGGEIRATVFADGHSAFITAPVPTSNYGTISIGKGNFAGSGITGSSSGTSLFISEVSGFGGDLINAGKGTTSYFKVTNVGNTTIGGTVSSTKYYVSALNTAPSSASDTGTTGEIRYTADYIFLCTATNTWKRVAIATW